MLPRVDAFTTWIGHWPTLVERACNWRATGLAYGASAVLTILYLTDWKAVNQYIPFYGSKYARGHPRRYSIEPIR